MLQHFMFHFFSWLISHPEKSSGCLTILDMTLLRTRITIDFTHQL